MSAQGGSRGGRPDLPRIVLILALVVILAMPSVAATPIATVAVGPGGVSNTTNRPYYWAANVSEPEGPGAASPADDCGRPLPPPNGEDPPEEPRDPNLSAHLARLAAWNPQEEPRISGWYPRCIVFSLGTSPVGTIYLAYNVDTGRYYVDAETSLAAAIPIPMGFSMAGMAMTGTTGAGSSADCVGCPPPP